MTNAPPPPFEPTDVTLRPDWAPGPAARAGRAPPKASLYPLQIRLAIIGAILGVITFALQDWAIGLSVFVLFAIVGATWRVDMIPIVPACLAYQWVSACTGYIFLHNVGYLPGRLIADDTLDAMLLSLLGLAALAAGIRFAFYLGRRTILRTTFADATPYNTRRLFVLTLMAFAVSYFVDIVPKAIWFGGAQIIETLLSLRFVPYFMLLLTVIERRVGYRMLALATAWVILPQLLTGFSDFKEILFVILAALLAQWRPWIRTPRQSRQNRQLVVMGLLGAVMLFTFGLVWNGGLKQDWRDQIWKQTVTASPTERITLFFEVAGRSVSHLDVAFAMDSFVGRVCSGEIFFSNVVERVPATLSHENGKLFWMAVSNAVLPRFLFPDKANLGGDSWLVRKYAGVEVSGDESGTSVGLGYMAEFYIDFGIVGVALLSMFWGMVGGGSIVLFAKVSPARAIFVALMIGVFTQYMMSFDGSFIKLFAGFIQRVALSAGVIVLFGPRLHRWLAWSGRTR